MEERLDREKCIVLLREKQEELMSRGEGRYPQRSDMTEDQVVAIKAHLGPWPRALEAAGLKPPRDDDRTEKNKEKRRRAKQRRAEALREKKG